MIRLIHSYAARILARYGAAKRKSDSRARKQAERRKFLELHRNMREAAGLDPHPALEL